MKKENITIEEFAIILKQKGIIEIAYQDLGGNEGFFNYSHAGVLFKDKFINLWRKFFVNSAENVFEIDGPTINKRSMLEKSGHVSTFFDYIVVNPKSGLKHRIDKLIEQQYPDIQITNVKEWYQEFLKTNKVIFEGDGGNRVVDVAIEQEKLMYEVQTGDLLRPETAQNIFVDGFNIVKNNGKISGNMPFAIAQIGKAYRKEISGSQSSLFRRKEFYQCELEWYCSELDSSKVFDNEVKRCEEFYYNILGFSKDRLRFRDIPKEDLSHYSKKTYDIEYKFPWGWTEIQGLANRTTYDIGNHHGRKDVYIIEPSFGVDRIMLAIIFEHLEIIKDEEGNIHYKFNYPTNLQPYDLTILPVVDSSKYNLLEHYNQCKSFIWDKYNILFLDQNRGSMPKRMLESDLIGAKLNIVLDQDVGEKVGSKINDGTVQLRKNGAKKNDQVKVNFGKKELLQSISEIMY